MADDAGLVPEENDDTSASAETPAAETSVDDAASQTEGSADAAAIGEQAASAASTKAAPTESSTASGTDHSTQGDVELLLQQAQAALDSLEGDAGSLPAGVEAFKFADFTGSPASTETASLELMRDVELDLRIELGRTDMHLEDVLRMKKGSLVTLDKLAGDPVDIYVNGRLIARGEVLVLNDNFCVRVAELIVGESACA